MVQVSEVAVIVAAILTIPLSVAESTQSNAWFGAADWVIWLVFLIDYIVIRRVAHESRLRHYAHESWLSLIVLVISFPLLPHVLGFGRLARLIRTLRLLRVGVVAMRALPSLREVFGRRGLLLAGGLTLTVVVLGAAAMVVVEPATVQGNLANAVWWALATVTTVGYGDISPHSLGGRLIAAALMFSGIGLASAFAASVAAHFVGEDANSKTSDISAQLDRLEQAIDRLSIQLARSTLSRAPFESSPIPKLDGDSAFEEQALSAQRSEARQKTLVP